MPDAPTLTGQDIAEAQGSVQALLEAILAKSGYTSNEYIALRVLAVRGPYAPAALQEFLAGQRQLRLNPADAAHLLAGLAAKGLITAPDPAGPDPVTLTAAGTTVYTTLNEAIAPTTRALYADIDEPDLRTAYRVLRHVVDEADRLRAALP